MRYQFKKYNVFQAREIKICLHKYITVNMQNQPEDKEKIIKVAREKRQIF